MTLLNPHRLPRARRARARRPRNAGPRARRQRRAGHRRPDAAGARQRVARHRRKIPRHRQRRHRHRRLDHRDRRAAAARSGSQLPQHRADRPGRRDQGERRGRRLFPARHHRISDDRRAGDADERSRAAADLQRHQRQAVEHRRRCSRTRRSRRRSTSSSSSASTSPCSAPPASASRTASPSCCQQILEERPDLRIFLIDPHNEYGRCFGDKAQVLTPRNLRLPFWLFNFEETVDAFFGGRPGIDEEVEILSEAIPEAKAAYVQLKGSNDRALTKKKDPQDRRLRRRHAGALPHRRSDHRDRRSDGQAGEPLAHDDLQQAAPAHQDLPQSPALRLHVRERHRRRRHHGGGGEPPVPHSERTASR